MCSVSSVVIDLLVHSRRRGRSDLLSDIAVEKQLCVY